MIPADRAINWNLRDLLCDRCLVKFERQKELPISELCERCKVKIVDWTVETLGHEGAERMLRTLDAHRGED